MSRAGSLWKVVFGKDRTIAGSFFRMTVLVATLALAALGGCWTFIELRAFQQHYETTRENQLRLYRALIQRETKEAEHLIVSTRAKTDARVRQTIRDRVYEAHAVAQGMYAMGRDNHSHDEMASMIREALRGIRFNEGRGYYFVIDMAGINQLYAAEPQAEGQDMMEVRDPQGRLVARDLLAIAREHGEGFYQYSWSKPGAEGEHRKVAFVKLFEPLGWCIATGEYPSDVDAAIQSEVLEALSERSFEHDGYLFAGTYEGISLMGPRKGEYTGDVEDANGVPIVQSLIEAAKSGGGFVEYVMPGFEGMRPLPKLSFALPVPDWGWYIGAGVYLDDIEQTIAKENQANRTALPVKIALILILMIAMAALCVVAALVAASRFQREIAALRAFLRAATTEDGEAHLDESALRHQELKELGSAVESMLQARRAAEAERLHLEGQLQQSQKLEAVGQLAGGIAHDFNNLLQVISGYNDMALAELPEASPVRDLLVESDGAAKRAATLVRQLLVFSRRAPSRPENLRIVQVTANLMKMMRRVIGEHIVLEVEHADSNAGIFADPQQIEQVLMNLLVNARDAMPEGGVIRIVTKRVFFDEAFAAAHTWSQAGEYLCIAVIDRGSGIAPDNLEHIFEPFFTTKEVGHGTGLGLATVYGIVKENEGFLHVESVPGDGATFEVYFPFRMVTPTVAAVSAPRANAPRGTGETILLAEDDPQVRALAVRVLESAGYALLVARDGVEAIDLFDGHPGVIKLAVLDAIMPRKNGLDVLRHLLARGAGVPVLFCSGYSDSMFACDDVLPGAYERMQKPFSPADLLLKVREMLDQPDISV